MKDNRAPLLFAMPAIVSHSDSEYFKRYGRYFDSRASYGREADTIIYFAFKTPTGKWSRSQWETLRFNSERNPVDMVNKIHKHFKEIQLQRQDLLRKGYRVAEVVLYSGELK